LVLRVPDVTDTAFAFLARLCCIEALTRPMAEMPASKNKNIYLDYANDD
jgi:hypothetical protein